ncbi:MAG: hypothetical protein ACXV7J_04280 [Methylomonas sp.]
MRKFSRLFDVTATIWIVGCVAILLAYGLWSLNRGLDLTDESYYLASAIHPDSLLLWATAMHWFTAGLWQLSGNLATFRGMGMAILVVSSVVLALGMIRAFETCGFGEANNRRSRTLIVAGSLVGAMLYHAFVPFTPSYNLLAVSGVYMGMGLVTLSVNSSRSLRFYGFQSFGGVALGIAFLAKFSSGIVGWGIACFITAMMSESHRDRILRMGLLTIGMAATVGIIIFLKTTFSEALEQFRLGTFVYMLGTNETFPERLARYFNQSADFLKLILTDFWIPLMLFGIYAVRPRFWLAAMGLAAFVYSVLTQGYYLGGMDRYDQQTAPLFVAVILCLLATARVWMQNKKLICLLAALSLLPFCIAIGTFNPLHLQILFSIAPWGLAAGLLAFALPLNADQRFMPELVCMLFVTLVTSQVLSNGFRGPYRLNRPLQEQSEAITIPPLGTFRVDRESRDAYMKLIQVADACGIHEDRMFLGLYNIPGIALIIQTVMPGFPLLQDRVSTEPILDRLPPETLKSAVVGIDRDSGSFDPGMPKQLARFPTDYRLCGTITIPFQKQTVELWLNVAQQ